MRLSTCKILLFALGLSSVSIAAEKKGKEKSTPKSSREAAGVTGFVPKRGFSVAGDVGLFFALGGYRATSVNTTTGRTFEPKGISCCEPNIGIAVAYDVVEWFAVGVRLSNGYVSNAARSTDAFESTTDYGLLFLDAVLTGTAPIYDRLSFAGSIFGGGSYMTPQAHPSAQAWGYNVGAGIGLRFDTLATNLVLGLDANGYFTMIKGTEYGAIPGILAFSVSPVVKYVF